MSSISTIIPVYNSEKYLEKTLESIINQTFKPYEIIIIIDGATDNSFDICKKYKKKYKNIKIINNKINRGVSCARNIGIKKARGEYIHFVDSDDILELNMYDEINDFLKNNKVDVVLTGTIHNEDETKTITTLEQMMISNINEMKEFLVKECINGRRNVFNYIWNKLYSRKLIKKNKLLFNEKLNFGEDFLFNCKVFKNTNSIFVSDKSYYNYIRRSGYNTLKTEFNKNKLELRLLFWESWKDLYNYYEIFNIVKDDMEKYEGSRIYRAILDVASPNCKISYEDKIKYISNFNNFQNTYFLYKYLAEYEIFNKHLEYLKNNKIEEFYNLIKN